MTVSAFDNFRMGPYRILHLLKAGGEGAVYAAEDPRLGRRVAIKLRPFPTGSEARQAVIDEARSLATLSHPNIVQLYDVIETEDTVALVMEYVPGSDLEQCLADVGTPVGGRPLDSTALDSTAPDSTVPDSTAPDSTAPDSMAPECTAPDMILRIGLSLCAALAAAHREGIVHGDIKPANVLIDTEGRIKLADFGVAFRQQHRKPRGGTPAMSSPEQRAGTDCDARSDLYSLGRLLARLLDAALPVPGGAGAAHSSPVASGLSTALHRLSNALLSPDPTRRPSSAIAVRQALLEIARGRLPAEGNSQRMPPRAADRARASRTGESRTGESRTGASRTGASRTGASRTGASRTGASRTGASRTGASRTGASRTGASRTGASRTASAGRLVPGISWSVSGWLRAGIAGLLLLAGVSLVSTLTGLNETDRLQQIAVATHPPQVERPRDAGGPRTATPGVATPGVATPGVATPTPAMLLAAVEAAVGRHPQLYAVSEAATAAATLELRLRCNPQVCGTRLILRRGDTRRADSRALLPDASEDDWADRLDQGLNVLFPPATP